MRVVFSVRNFWYLKFFDRVIHELVRRDHHVHVTAERQYHWKEAMEQLAREHPSISFSTTPRVATTWLDLSVRLRRTIDFVRFLTPAFAAAPVLRQRAEARAPDFVRRCMRWPILRRSRVAYLLERGLTRIESALPVAAVLRDFLHADRPDVLVISPLIALGSTQFDMLQAAQSMGIPTALAVGSWDHLSSKTLIRSCPDRLFVWNEMQQREAETFHGVPADRVVVTGAQCFDQWFDRQPGMDRDSFCRLVNLPATRPYVLYVCSALFEGSPSEAEFAAQWVGRLRASPDPVLRDAPILIRPHPKRAYQFDSVSFEGVRDVSLWPRQGEVPISDAAKNAYFDSIFHCAAVVGLNTSAMIEAAIVGRSVHTILLPEFHDNQGGTLHFRHLLEAGGGLLRTSHSLEEHLAQLRAVLEAPGLSSLNDAFVQAFVRPHGLQRAATPIFVDALEQLAGHRRAPYAPPLWARAVRTGLWPLAVMLRETADTEKIWKEARRAEKAVRMQAHRERKRASERRRKKVLGWRTAFGSWYRNLFGRAS